MRIITGLMILILIVFGVTFAVLNAQVVEVNYYLNTISLPLSMVIVTAFACGGLFGVLFSLRIWFRMKRKQHHIQHQLKLAEKECANLRNIPIKDEH